jgi:hypothetical protein
MTEHNEKMKKAEQHLTEALAHFAETDSDTPEQDEAKEQRAKAEQEIAEARGSKHGRNS